MSECEERDKESERHKRGEREKWREREREEGGRDKDERHGIVVPTNNNFERAF